MKRNIDTNASLHREHLQEQVRNNTTATIIKNKRRNVKKRQERIRNIQQSNRAEANATSEHNPCIYGTSKRANVNVDESIFIRPSLRSIQSILAMSDASLKSSTQSNTVVFTPYTDNRQRRQFGGGDFERASDKSRKCFLASSAMLKPMSRTGKIVSCLVSCVVFFMVLCACLVAALVLVGRHVMAAAMADRNGGGFMAVEGGIGAEKETIPAMFRLPANTKPIHYDITMMPDLNNASFKGKVKITIDLSEERQDILLHSYKLLIDQIFVEKNVINDTNHATTTIPPIETSSNELNFTPAYLRATENATAFPTENQEENLILNCQNITVIDFELIEESQMLKINLREKLTRGVYDINIEFHGDMKVKIVGFYYSEYVASINGTSETEKRPIATTKFEPTYARQAYPCFDEPNLKATYTVHLLKPKDEFIALSNMPEKSESQTTDEGILVSFQSSERMSTYLVCFIISTMEYTNTTFGTGENERPLRVFATPGQKEKTEYALQTGKKIMNFYLKYFDIPYPLPKLDMVAIPDFVSGAMENWGLVTFRETALLYDIATSSVADKARVAETVAHELAHSWFGNLVTMDWWDDLWLNEGFASYIEYKGVNASEENWHVMDQFLIADLHGVLVLDATTASHPIVQSADTPDQITAMFDPISYKKGAAILRMLEDAITPAKFREGVKKYLVKYKYGNAVTNDFWNEMNAVSEDDVDVATIMKTWTTQMGYPLVTVTKSGTKYTLKQQRYLTNADLPDNNPDYKWIIPITYITDKANSQAEKIRQLKWFPKDEPQIEIDIPDAVWVKFNFHQTGYYRINYAESEWKQFTALLKRVHTIFDVTDRANLLEESFRLAESGHVSYNIPLNLSKYLLAERDFVVWSVADHVLGQLKTYLFNFASNDVYQKYVANLIKPVVGLLTWEENDSESDLEKRLRPLAIKLACQMGDSYCLNKTQSKFQEWLGDELTPLHQNIRGIVYNYGIQRATKDDWHKVLKKYEKSTDANEKIQLLNALSRIKDPELLQSLILYAQDRAKIRDQDYFNCITLISNNPSGTALVWNYVRSNWLKIVDRFTLNERNLGKMIPQITKRFSTQVALDEMIAFFAKHTEAGAGAAARLEALETVKNNINWVSKYEKTVSDWIIANQ